MENPTTEKSFSCPVYASGKTRKVPEDSAEPIAEIDFTVNQDARGAIGHMKTSIHPVLPDALKGTPIDWRYEAEYERTEAMGHLTLIPGSETAQLGEIPLEKAGHEIGATTFRVGETTHGVTYREGVQVESNLPRALQAHVQFLSSQYSRYMEEEEYASAANNAERALPLVQNILSEHRFIFDYTRPLSSPTKTLVLLQDGQFAQAHVHPTTLDKAITGAEEQRVALHYAHNNFLQVVDRQLLDRLSDTAIDIVALSPTTPLAVAETGANGVLKLESMDGVELTPSDDHTRLTARYPGKEAGEFQNTSFDLPVQLSDRLGEHDFPFRFNHHLTRY